METFDDGDSVSIIAQHHWGAIGRAVEAYELHTIRISMASTRGSKNITVSCQQSGHRTKSLPKI